MERIILSHWNKQTGPEPIIQYPPEKPFPPKDLFLKIWAKHELNKENSMIEFIPEDGKNSFVSIIQQFEGELYFMIIVYDQDNIGETTSPDILASMSKNLIELINTNKITRAISEAFTTIKNYSKLDEEENLINFFQDKIKYTILQILRDGVVSRFDLTNKLRQDYGFSTLNIDLILISFIRENLIIKENVPGSKECYFLVKDLSCMRIPPKSLPMDKEEDLISRKYKKELENFYYNYDIVSEIENKTIIQSVLLDKDVFSLIKTLRKENLTVNDCLNILNNREELFNELLAKKFIYETRGFVYIFSDVRFIKFNPYYIIEKLVERYQKQEISLNEYLTHLKLLSGQTKDTSSIDYEIV
ncbi:MAG: hypothetical protein KAX18_03770 [Candidatus Lokiarchaeota archaeon]|jgi:hypothetical protein|nr:hypothetical protein [Candidatus Lokiarchaeota archaeon]